MVVATMWWQWFIIVPGALFALIYIPTLLGTFLHFVWTAGHDEWCSHRYYSHFQREMKHWRRRSALIADGAPADSQRDDDPVTKHHVKALRHREKARRWKAYQDAVEAARDARREITTGIYVDLDEPESKYLNDEPHDASAVG